MPQKTLCIAVFHAYIARNILYGKLLDELAKDGVRIILLVPTHKYDFYRDIFSTHIGIEPMDVDAFSKSRRYHLFLRTARLLQRSHYLWYRRVEQREASQWWKGWPKYLAEEAVVALFGNRRLPRRVYRALYRRYAATYGFEKALARINPSLVFVTDLLNEGDLATVLAARRLGFPVIGMARSWDNFVSKGILPIIPDQVIVNTNHLADDAVMLHGVPREDITVVGMPQFDRFLNEPRMSRDEFMVSIGAPKDAKLVVFAPGGTVLSKTDGELCEILDEALANGTLHHKIHILVRNHPNHPADLRAFEGKSHFTIEYPGVSFGGNIKETELTTDQHAHLADTLKNADVVLWVATTLGIDSAVFGKPQVAINFDGKHTLPYNQSVRKYLDEDHMKLLIATGGVHVSRDAKDLIGAINRYLDDSTLDREGRARIVAEQIVWNDGKGGERLLAAVRDALANV
jgi:hypothetical protein